MTSSSRTADHSAPRFGYVPGKAFVANRQPGWYIWDSAPVAAEGNYYLFCSRWPERAGFGYNWLFRSEICQFVSDSPRGPFRFLRVVLPARGETFFDGRNTHNTCVRYYGGKYYLYYMGTTYAGTPDENLSNRARVLDVWNHKRIGLAVADSIEGEFRRLDEPLLEAREAPFWDRTAITNPAVAIRPDGKTYLIYKSRRDEHAPMQLGVAVAPRPEGPFVRLSDEPLIPLADPRMMMEDPFLWYDEKKERFCLLAKDDPRDGVEGVCGEWGAGFYAESPDCVHYTLQNPPLVYSRRLCFEDGEKVELANLERPSVLFDDTGRPAWLYFAAGMGKAPYAFEGGTFVVGVPLEPEK